MRPSFILQLYILSVLYHLDPPVKWSTIEVFDRFSVDCFGIEMSSDESQASGSSTGSGGNAIASGTPALVPLELGSMREFDTKGNPNGIS